MMPRLSALAIIAALCMPSVVGAQSEQYRTGDGRVFLALADTGVIRAAEQAYRAEPTLANALALGAAQSSMRWYAEAIRTYTGVIATWPDSAIGYRWRGHRHLTLRNLIAARADLQTAVQLDPKLYGGWYHLGIVEFIDGDFAAAVDAFRRAIPLAPDAGERAGSTDWLWQALSRCGDHRAADSLLAMRPDSVPANNAYATRLKLYRGELQPDRVFGPADTTGIQRATLAFGLASWYFVQGDTASAEAWMLRAYAESDGWPSFGFIAAEGQLAGRTVERSAVVWQHAGHTPCVMAIPVGEYVAVTYAAYVTLAEPALERDKALRGRVVQLVESMAAAFRRRHGGSDAAPLSASRTYDWRHAGGVVTLRFLPDGKVSAAAEPAPTEESSPAGDLAAAIGEIVGPGAWELPGAAERADQSIVAHVWIMPREDLAVSTSGTAPAREPSRLDLFQVRMPRLTRPRALGNNPNPEYPRDLILQEVEGRVELTYHIDEQGKVVMATVREQWPLERVRPRAQRAAQHAAFRAATLAALAKTRYTPATLGGCPIRESVAQPFVFRISQ